jgi:hypothetical protein
MGERIERVAIKTPSGVWSLPCPPNSHYVVAVWMAKSGIEFPLMNDQGFVTDSGRFVEREEAMRIAIDSGQVSKERYSADDELFSEDLTKDVAFCHGKDDRGVSCSLPDGHAELHVGLYICSSCRGHGCESCERRGVGLPVPTAAPKSGYEAWQEQHARTCPMTKHVDSCLEEAWRDGHVSRTKRSYSFP